MSESRFLHMLIAICILIVGVDSPAFAYLDPGTGSIILQLVLGGVAGALVIVKLYWYRLKSLFGPGAKSDEPQNAGDKEREDQ